MAREYGFSISWLLGSWIGAAAWMMAAQADPNASTPGALLIDNPTIHNLSFRWLLEGDANSNATAQVYYRAVGEKSWRESQPLLRVRHMRSARWEATDVPPMLAGSVLGLEGGTQYEVELSFHDPDGGKATERVTVWTRAEPVENAPGNRTMHVYPENRDGGDAGREDEGFGSLEEAFERARPGDVVELHPGIYEGPFTVTVSGTAEDPIIFRGPADGSAVIDGGGDDDRTIITLAEHTDHVHFERLTIRSGRVGIRGTASRGIVVRRCRISDVLYGISAAGEPHWSNADWYIADNTLVGRYEQWRQRTADHFGAGINVAGRGHVVCYNEIGWFWDAISTAHIRARDIEPEWAVAPEAAQHAMDIYNNDLGYANDDAIEADHLFSNIRIQRNRMLNSHVGISIQPSFGGPIYITHNVAANMSHHPWKLHIAATGVLMYHNTTISSRYAMYQRPPTLRNSHARNNIFLGVGSARWSSVEGAGNQSTMDYNLYAQPRADDQADETQLFQWTTDAGETWEHFETLESFAEATGQERRGRVSDSEAIFIGPVRFDWEERDYQPAEMDLRLDPAGAAVNAGVVLPNINDNHPGPAPDLGAYQLGDRHPHYGPRPTR